MDPTLYIPPALPSAPPAAESWTFFQILFDTMIQPFITASQGITATVIGNARPFGLALVVVWIAIEAIEIAMQRREMKDFVRGLLIASLFIGLLNADAYQQYISTFVLETLPKGFAQMFGLPATNVAAILDQTVGSARVRTEAALQALGDYSLKAAVAAIFFTGAIWMDYILSGIIFIVVTIAQMMTTILIEIGPIFIALAAGPKTRFLASGWWRATLSSVIFQCLTLAILYGSSTGQLAAIDRLMPANGVNPNVASFGVCLVQVLVIPFLVIVLQFMAGVVSHSIGGGIAHAMPHLGSVVGGAYMIARATRTVTNAVSGAAGAYARSGGVPGPQSGWQRQATPPGNLSRGTSNSVPPFIRPTAQTTMRPAGRTP